VEKGFKGKHPLTTLRLAHKGREAFQDYAGKMKSQFKDLPT
jgi:hypothetical protein